MSLARNYIGWTVGSNSATHSSGQTVANLNQNETVKVSTGVRQGEVYRYLGTNRTSVDLRTEDYGNPKLWQRIDLSSTNSEVVAKISNSKVTAADELNVKAKSDSRVTAEVMAGSFAAGGGTCRRWSERCRGWYGESYLQRCHCGNRRRWRRGNRCRSDSGSGSGHVHH